MSISRRTLIGGTACAAITASVAVGARPWWRRLTSSGQFETSGRPYSMAMHVHAAFSEGPGSMEAQLEQAAQNGVDVVWWTEHDHRMAAHRYREEVHFDSLRELEKDVPWSWRPVSAGRPAKVQHELSQDDTSPRDANSPRSLLLAVEGRPGAHAEHRLVGTAPNYLFRTSLDGLVVELDVKPQALSPAAYVALEILTSERPARNGRPAGRYRLSYRIGGSDLPGVRKVRDRRGIITLEAPLGRWTTLRLTPADDLASLWPDVDGRDASMFEVSVAAVATGKARAAARLDLLRFRRPENVAARALRTQSELMAAYTPQFPTVKQIRALEISVGVPHISWFGGPITADALTHLREGAAAVQLIHAAGGIASYNHPFGTAGGRLPQIKQDKERKLRSAELIANRALGCDLLEVGYPLRGGCDLSQHERLWDACSRNAIFLTGTGVSDDHKGIGWASELLNFITWAWSQSDSEAHLIAALRKGRAYFGDPRQYRGQLDLLVDDSVRMGAVSVAGKSTRGLRVLATGVPDSGRVVVVRGVVDRAGPNSPDATVTRTPLAADAFDSLGQAVVDVDTRTACFVRVVVETGDGAPVAFSNPIWLLRDIPPGGIPAGRRG